MMQAVAPRWESFCVTAEQAGVTESWGVDFDTAKGWNRALLRYGSDGWEPFQLLTLNANTAIVTAVCFKRPAP